jgi:hypothetical protein
LRVTTPTVIAEVTEEAEVAERSGAVAAFARKKT